MEFVTNNPITLLEDDGIKKAAALFIKHAIDGAPVINGREELVGIFTKTHLYRAFVNGCDPDTPVSQFMKQDLKTIGIEGLAEEAWQMAINFKIGRLPVVDHNGKLVAIMTRTDLVRAFEQKKLETIEQLNAILESAHNGIYAIGRDGSLITFNRSAERLSGYKAADVLGKHIHEFEIDPYLLEVLQSGTPEFGRRQVLNNKLVVVNRTPVLSGGKAIGAVAVMQDISELATISRELSDTTELYEDLEAVINSSYDGIAVVDHTGKVIRCNKAFDKTVLDAKAIGAVIRSISLKSISEKKPATLVHRFPDGRELLLTANPVYRKNAGNIPRVVVNCRDITELINLRREVETSRELTEVYHSELETLRTRYLGHTIVCNSQAMRNVLDLAIRVARVESTILMLGESGVGKDVVTRLIHKASKRAQEPFIRINCGAIPENLLESELFGYEPGAFTGASREGKPGMIELANKGTLFLDEVAELPLSLQVKLLNLIQDREVTRVGGVKPTGVDLRLVAATNKNLDLLVQKGQFRADLFYRLNVVPITIPPLRERRDDIPFLVIHFVRKFNEKYQLNKTISTDAMDYLTGYHWPGNVRELENLIERLMVITPQDIIEARDLPLTFLSSPSKSQTEIAGGGLGTEKEIIEELYLRLGSTRKVASAMGVNQSTIVRKMKKYNISPVSN